MKQSELILFETVNGEVAINVYLSGDTVWLSLNQLAALFDRDKSVISRHFKNIFGTKELDRDSVVAFFATTASDGKNYDVEYYNLDAILSIGYRVNSKRGIEFRKWASKVLNNHLLKGYTLNKNKFNQKVADEISQVVSVMSRTLQNMELVNDIGKGVLDIIENYTRTWSTLLQYDENSIELNLKHEREAKDFMYEDALPHIAELKNILISKGEASHLFGIERDKGLESILCNLRQTFDQSPIYASNIERASHLLYFIIKDHPFIDGNKRIACLLFLMYLSMTQISTDRVSNQYMTALALLIAESDPSQKDIMIKLTMKMLEE